VSDHAATDGGHLSADALADLQEGLLDDAAARSADAHLDRCERCAADQQALAALPGLLAGTADAGPVPADVATRLEAALATEARSTAAAVTVTPLGTARRPARGMRVLQAAAVLVLLLAGVGLGVSAIQGGGGDSGQTADSAGGSAAAQPDDGSFPVTASGRNWSEDTVTAAVPEIVAGRLGPPVRETAADRAGADGEEAEASRELAANPAGRLAGGPELAECVTALNDGPVTPVAVDLASWQGQPAAVVVLPTPGDPATVDTWVVAPDCAQADAKVLYFARVARP
jgi:hypothetical protein